MRSSQTLLLFVFLAGMFSCNAKKRDDRIIDTNLGDIHLPNQEAENDFNKGLYYVRQENYSTAKDFFLSADEESPNTPVILNAIGNCLDRTGEALKGFIYYKKAMQIDSNFKWTYINYGCSLNNNRRFDESERIFRLGLGRPKLSSFERGSLYCNLAYTYAHRDQIDSALSLLDSAKIGLKNGQLYNTIIQFEKEIKQGSYPRSMR
jgi:tetratricopeptide (TPR) repeat protein